MNYDEDMQIRMPGLNFRENNIKEVGRELSLEEIKKDALKK